MIPGEPGSWPKRSPAAGVLVRRDKAGPCAFVSLSKTKSRLSDTECTAKPLLSFEFAASLLSPAPSGERCRSFR